MSGLAIYRIDRGFFPINRAQMSDFLSWIALGVIIGGRAGYMIFYQPDRLLDNPLSLLYVWEGGMAFHGGLVGVIALTWIFARKHQVAPLAVTHLKLTLDLIIKSIWAVCPLCELFLMSPPEKTLYLRLENKRVKFTAA